MRKVNLDDCQKWLDQYPLNQRLLLLGVGCAVLVLLWYTILIRPIGVQRSLLLSQAQSISSQVQIFELKSETILKSVANNQLTPMSPDMAKSKQQKTEKLMTAIAVTGTDEQLVKAILNSSQQVRFLSLKNSATDKSATPNNLRLEFRGSYFETLAYLHYLERLPWCMSWDNLSYKVEKYPEATIVLMLGLKNIS